MATTNSIYLRPSLDFDSADPTDRNNLVSYVRVVVNTGCNTDLPSIPQVFFLSTKLKFGTILAAALLMLTRTVDHRRYPAYFHL